MNSCDLSALCPLRPGLQRFHDPTYFSCLFPDLKTTCSATPGIPYIVPRGSMQPFYSHLLISSTHLNQMTGLMILMTKAGFAVPHRHFFPTCMLPAYFFLSFEPTGLANAITGHYRLNIFSLFFLPLASRVSKTDELIPRPGLQRSKQTFLFPFAWYL